jgi:DNA polymerase III subunit delta'
MLPGTERHPHARAVLTPALPPDGSPSHAYLFHGPAGSGKRAVARAFAAALLADGAPDPANAQLRAEHGVHPDLTWVTPSGAAEMLVSDIDEPVVAAAARTPFESRRRVFVIERVDTMHENAANRMLKTLEEPPPFAHLLLLTDRPADVLPTIVSRCQSVRFDAPTIDELTAAVQRHGIEQRTAQACARLALGDGDRALALAVGNGPALRAAAERYARCALHGRSTRDAPHRELLAQAKKAAEARSEEVEQAAKAELEYLPRKEHRRVEREAGERAKRVYRRTQTGVLDEGVQLASLWLRDVMCVVEGSGELVHHADRADELARDAEDRNAHRLRAAVALCDDTRANWILNPSEELALEALSIRLERELT